MHRFAIWQRKHFVDLDGLFLKFAFAVDLAIRLCLFESVFRDAVFEFILIACDFANQLRDVESFSRFYLTLVLSGSNCPNQSVIEVFVPPVILSDNSPDWTFASNFPCSC